MMLPSAERVFLALENIIGISTDILFPSSLHYFVDEDSLVLNMRGYSEENELPAKYLPSSAVNSDLQEINFNSSLDLDKTFAPINFHFSYGIPLNLSMLSPSFLCEQLRVSLKDQSIIR